MDLEKFKEKLAKYGERDIVFTSHAEIRALFRDMDLDEIRMNILKPKKLVKVINDGNKGKYGCYFAYSKTHCHKYVLVLNSKVIIVTVININRDWQRMLKWKNLI